MTRRLPFRGGGGVGASARRPRLHRHRVRALPPDRRATAETPPLPPELAERVARGLRRPAVDAWRDRADDAPPVRWEVDGRSSRRPTSVTRPARNTSGSPSGWPAGSPRTGLDEVVVLEATSSTRAWPTSSAQRRRAGCAHGVRLDDHAPPRLRADGGRLPAPSYRPVPRAGARRRARRGSRPRPAAGPTSAARSDIEDRWGVDGRRPPAGLRVARAAALIAGLGSVHAPGP